MKIMLLLLLMTVCSGSLFAQKPTGDAKSEAPCSPAVTGDNNTFIFRYCGSDPEEEKRILRLLKAVAEGESLANGKLDEILAILNKPTKIVLMGSSVVSATPSGHPQTTLKFYTEDPVDRGQFEIECDRACTPVKGCTLIGGNSLLLAIVDSHPEIAEFLFQRQFPSLTQCDVTVESRDDKPINIIGMKTSNRLTGLDFNIPQPPTGCVVTAGGSMLC